MWSSAKSSVWSGDAAQLVPWTPAEFDLRPPAPAIAAPAEPERDPVAEAYALGFTEGRQEGERAERARLRPTVRAAEEAIESINEREAKWTGAVEQNLVTLALAIARHIVDREVASDPSVVDKLVRRAIASFPVDQPVHVRVHPDDLAIITSMRGEGPRDDDRPDTMLTWAGDARITRGGCVVEGRERIIDGRVDTALERVYRRLAHHHA